MVAITLVLGLFLLLKINLIQGQTCDEIKYITIKDARRSTKFKSTANNYLCDQNFIKDDHWYRFDSLAGNRMPTQNPGNDRCGTYVPIWLQGTHPTTDNVVMDATACAAVPFVFPFGCGVSYNIKVIKCGDFYLYRLKEPKQCQFAYCAGDKLPDIKCSVTGETLPVCPGVIPGVTVGADAKHEVSEEVRLRCFWESPGNLTNVEYEARWFGDSQDIKPKIQRNFTGLETPEFLFQPRLYKNKLNDKIGYEFHKHVYCAVRARYKTGAWSKWISSKTIYTGMEVSPTYIPINDCGEKNREVIITLRPHLPIRGNPVKIDIQSPRTKLIDEICVVGDKQGFANCGLIFKSGHRVGRSMRFKLMTSCATGDNSDTLDGEYRLTHSFFDANNNIFWVNHQFPVIKVSRKKYKKKQCWSTGDPHFYTFDGRRYDFYGRGTFLLYRNTFYGTEIQVRQRACNGGTPSCNCGIAIKENLFYKIYDLCYTEPGRPWWENNLRSRLRTQQLRDFKLNRFYSTASQQGSTTKFEITLPSGVKVIVDRQYWGLNLYVWAPADTENPSEGLCGNNNGDANDDFGQWNSANKFGEHWRIRSHFTLFDYKGNKFKEDQLSDGCDQKICVCSRGNIKRCGLQAEAICFPELGSQNARAHHQGSGIGECDNRPKRAITPQDDSVDDQDDIPPFNPAVTNVNLTLSWPTQSGITKENVTQFCENKLLYSKAGAACSQLNGVDVDGLVQQCITDIQATEDFSWAAGNFAALETSCIANIFNNISSFKNTSDGSIELDTDVLTSLCPNDCSDHGNCTNSTCTCYEDYTAADCSISLKESPLVFDIRKSGLCDRRRRPCRNVGIFANPLLDSENLTCHVQEYKVIDSVWTPRKSVTLYPGQLVDLTEVKCSLPESPVNIGDYGNEGVTAAGLKIAVSNNRINASKDSMLFITYDSVCQECNTATGCQLRTDACIISGHCFSKNDSNPRDWCQQCLPDLSTTSWTRRQDNRPPLFTTSNVFYAFLGKELRVQLRANDPENRTFLYSFAQTETFGASLSKNGSFTWLKNTKNSTMFAFKVTDECGASSTLSVSVVIKECPCQNFGKCLPDHRDLDGTGNFTCSCTEQYTGSLCELDVNECNVSMPCINGSCYNQQPGFSCSCFLGFTGRLCETEINECESNPCFLGVPCKDMIAGYKCGPCPSGYTGNGLNCSRNDGQVDECVKNPEVCHANGICGYNNGSYECQCVQGYTGNGKDNCTDIDECQQSPCHSLANCSNTKGSYSCHCSHGLTGDGKINCTDIDECLESPCHQDAQCINNFSGYSCKCKQGYIGDGVSNCKENQPPQFLSPDKLLFINNVKLSIQIKAQDPDDQNITFTLLRNGTLTLGEASITENGFLLAHPHKNGTLFIQAADEMGVKTVLILHINMTQCPCQNDGKCYKNEKVAYPVKASDYLCQCKEQYTGKLCEKTHNSCNEQSCFPGLKCSPAQNQSEGFICEKCPPMFVGDGRHCELNITKGKNSVFQSTIKLTSGKWNEKLRNAKSKEYKILASRIIVEIRNIYKHRVGFSYVIIKSFKQGSIIVELLIIFNQNVKDPFKPLQEAAKTGKLGTMTFEIQHSDDTVHDKDSEDKILGLDKTIFIVIIVAVVVLILIIILAVCLRKRSKSHKANVTLKTYQPAPLMNAEDSPFPETQNGKKDEIDLDVLDDDNVCTKEEIKLKV